MTRLNLAIPERFHVMKTVANGLELLLLDRIWTGHLSTAKTIPKQQQDELGQVVDRMSSLLDGLHDDLPTAASEVCRDERLFSDVLMEGIVSLSQRCSACATRLQMTLNRGGSQAAAARSHLEQWAASTEQEKQALKEKMSVIRAGKFTTGDISGSCALGIALGILTIEDPFVSAVFICAGCGC